MPCRMTWGLWSRPLACALVSRSMTARPGEWSYLQQQETRQEPGDRAPREAVGDLVRCEQAASPQHLFFSSSAL